LFRSILDDTQMARQQLTELQDRHGEFMKLEASVREVRDMFMDLAALVQEQGEVIDNIAIQEKCCQMT
jgi:t-SNARE complex subunit (syntaxin)